MAIATGSYAAATTYPQLDVASEVATLREWFCAAGFDEDRRFRPDLEHLAADPDEDTIRTALRTKGAFGPDEAVVVYVTGHGDVVHGTHRTILHDSDPERVAHTSLRTVDLVEWLAGHAGLEHVLLVIDQCNAGALLDEVTTELRAAIPRSWIALLATEADRSAGLGAFTAAVDAALRDLLDGQGRDVSELEPFLESDVFVKRVKGVLARDHGQDLEVIRDPYATSCCLPNPRYDPHGGDRVATAPQRSELAVLTHDMVAHWRQRAPLAAATTPWVFTGRRAAMQRLVDATTGPAGTLVVTGRAGSGKSALLARLVTCSDPQFRAEHADLLADVDPLPAEGAVDVAVVATGKGPEQVLAQVAGALGVEIGPVSAATGITEPLERLRTHLLLRPSPPTVVLDALDESSDPVGIVTTVLARCNPSDEPLLRLVVGVRSVAGPDADDRGVRDLAATTRLALAAEELAVDEDPWWDPADLERFVAGALGHPPSPYADADDVAERVATHVATGSERSFLLARLVTEDLVARDDALAADDPRLRDLLDGGVTEVLRRDLVAATADDHDRQRAVVLLRAVALAFGRGLPWRHVWPTVATAIAPRDRILGDADVAWLLGSRLAGYLVRDLEDGVTVHRLFHDALRERLAGAVDAFVDGDGGHGDDHGGDDHGGDGHPGSAAAHARITRALLPALTDRDRPPAAYVRRHLVEHAAEADMLDQDVLNPRTLPHMDASTLSRALRLTRADPQGSLGLLLGAWRGVRQRWSWDDPRANAAALDVALVAVSGVAPDRDDRDGPTWRAVWAEWASGGTVVGTESRQLRALAFGEVGGRRCLVSADWSGVRSWDAATSEQVGTTMDAADVRSLLAVSSDAGELVACGGSGLQVRDLATGSVRWRHDTEGIVYALAHVTVGDRDVVVAGSSDGTVTFHDAVTGAPRRLPLGPGAPVRALHAAVDPARPAQGHLLVVGRQDGGVEQWWVETGAPAGPRIDVGGEVNAVALVVTSDGLRIATGATSGRVQLWDAASGHPTGAVHEHAGEVRALATTGAGAAALLASAGHDAVATLLDATTGHVVAEPMPHPSAVEDVAFGVVDGRLLVATACADGNARLWDPNRPSAARVRTGGTVQDVALLDVGGTPTLLGSRADGIVPVWSALDGGVRALPGAPQPTAGSATAKTAVGAATGPVAMTAGVLRGRRVVVLGAGREVLLGLLDEPGPPVVGRWSFDAGRIADLVVHDDGLLGVLVDDDPDAARVEVVDLAGEGSDVASSGGSVQTLAARTVGDVGAAHQAGVAVAQVAGLPTLVTVVLDDRVEVLHATTLEPFAPPVPREADEWARRHAALGMVDGRAALAVWRAGGIAVWDLAAGTPIGPGVTFEGLSQTGLALAPLGNGSVLLSGHHQTVRAWNPRTGRLLAELPFGTSITSLAALPRPDGTLLVATGGPGVVMATLRP